MNKLAPTYLAIICTNPNPNYKGVGLNKIVRHKCKSNSIAGAFGEAERYIADNIKKKPGIGWEGSEIVKIYKTEIVWEK